MTGNPLDRPTAQGLVTSHPEVELALMLARTIDSIQADPEQLRSAIYELARQKLRDQFTGIDPPEAERLRAALEVAIHGVEAHAQKSQQRAPSAVPSDRLPPPPALARHSDQSDAVMPARGMADPDVPAWPWASSAAIDSDPDEIVLYSKRSLILPLGLTLLIAAALGGVSVFAWGRWGHRAQGQAPMAVSSLDQRFQIPAQPPAVPPAAEPPKPDPLLPTSYGIYAVSGGKLYELEPLQGRAPDIRVAVSAAITTPSQTVLPDGNIRFIVFRRDPSGSAPDQADVRVVARIEQAMTFDPAGKPILSKAEPNWVIRNIVSFPYRTAPIKGNPEMYELQSKDSNSDLPPGRYALILKAQSYDFTVSGNVTDKRQCLAKLSAANGVFYSECQKLP